MNLNRHLVLPAELNFVQIETKTPSAYSKLI